MRPGSGASRGPKNPRPRNTANIETRPLIVRLDVSLADNHYELEEIPCTNLKSQSRQHTTYDEVSEFSCLQSLWSRVHARGSG